MKYKAIFFDLDGTLSDPEEGILNSIQYAADFFGVSTKRKDLVQYIGPPLKDTFNILIGEDLAEQGVTKYRERFDAGGGLFENTLYPQVKETLCELKNRGYILCTASSKPQVFVERILNFFNIDIYFDFVGGATLDGKIGKKEDVISYVLAQTGIEAKQVLMVGDRKYDLLGAQEFGMDAVGVLYGFGDYNELSSCKNIALISSIQELLNII